MKYLILRSDGLSLKNKFENGIKIRPERLMDVKLALFIDDNIIKEVYDIDNIVIYNRDTGRIDLDCLNLQENHDLIGDEFKVNTFNPATIAEF